MSERTIAVEPGLEVSLSTHGAGATWLALAPGAGGTRRTGLLLRCAEAVAASGRGVVLFNFPYGERRRRVPDPPAILERTVAAVAALARAELGARRLVLGGKSMGGRMASQAVAGGLAADGLAFLGYPLHPPGRPEKLRDRHLPAVAVPMLFVQGGRDAFARPDLLRATLARLGDRATLIEVADGDHSFAVPKRQDRTPAQVEASIFGGLLGWLDGLGL